jgi:hypothetical protein
MNFTVVSRKDYFQDLQETYKFMYLSLDAYFFYEVCMRWQLMLVECPTVQKK